MNKLTIIGNLTRDPEQNTTPAGKSVCNFTVAVNRRRRTANNDQPEADFFRVGAWGELGNICHKYLAKGRKVCVIGAVQAKTYTDNSGNTKASLEIPFADDIEFLTPKSEAEHADSAPAQAPAVASNGATMNTDDLPF